MANTCNALAQMKFRIWAIWLNIGKHRLSVIQFTNIWKINWWPGQVLQYWLDQYWQCHIASLGHNWPFFVSVTDKSRKSNQLHLISQGFAYMMLHLPRQHGLNLVKIIGHICHGCLRVKHYPGTVLLTLLLRYRAVIYIYTLLYLFEAEWRICAGKQGHYFFR